jgi:CBS-domain-containing membrane protein
MFSVYGTSGQLFRGSMEQLRQVGGVGALARTRGILPIAKDGRDGAEESQGVFDTVLKKLPSGEDRSHQGALYAYAQAQQNPRQRRPLTTVADLMNRQPVTLPDSATVLQAWHVLADKGIGQAPVIDSQGHLVGLLTRADLLKPNRLPDPDSHALVWRALLMQSVKDIMWTPVPSAWPDSDIRHVARVLLDTGLPGLPVVEDHGTVVGFISRSDILRAVVTDPPLDLWG